MPIEPKVADALSKLLGERKGKKGKKTPKVGEAGSPHMGPPASLANAKPKPKRKKVRRATMSDFGRRDQGREAPADAQRPRGLTRFEENAEWNRTHSAEILERNKARRAARKARQAVPASLRRPTR